MKRILIINNGLACGGIENSSTIFANNFAEKGYDVHLLSVYNRPHFYSLNDKIKFYEPAANKKNKYLRALSIMAFARKITSTIQPDLIISHGEWINPFIILALYKYRKKMFLQDHMSPDLNMGFIYRFLTGRLYRKVCGVIVLTEYAKKKHQNRNKVSNIQVIPNSVRIIETPHVLKEDRIISVGRLSKEKGHEYLIRAFAKLENKWILDIVGDGPEYEKLRALSETLHISDKIVFHGYKLDFSEIIAKAKIFVLPSLYECFPQALIEAMALKLPCIATNCILDSSIIVNNYNGLLVEPGNVAALATGMDKLIKNENLRCSISKNAMKVRESFHVDTIVTKYLNFIIT